jgi:hypothetical protein
LLLTRQISFTNDYFELLSEPFGRAFEPDNFGFDVRLESLTYSRWVSGPRPESRLLLCAGYSLSRFRREVSGRMPQSRASRDGLPIRPTVGMHRPKLAIEMLSPRRGATGYLGGGERPEAAIETHKLRCCPCLSGRELDGPWWRFRPPTVRLNARFSLIDRSQLGAVCFVVLGPTRATSWPPTHKAPIKLVFATIHLSRRDVATRSISASGAVARCGPPTRSCTGRSLPADLCQFVSMPG